jgi:ferredoxin
VPTIRLGGTLGLGTLDSGRIEVLGDSVEACRTPARLPRPDWKRLPFLGSQAYRIRGSSFFPRVDPGRCEQCHTCSEVCPVDAVGYAPLPRFTSRCMYCYSCYENCPSNAIRLDCRWYLRKLVASRAEGLVATGKGANEHEDSVRP